MKQSVPLVLLIAACAVASPVTNRADTKVPGVSGPRFTRVYDEFDITGYYYDFTGYVPDLWLYNFDNVIRSACQTGVWFYYEQIEYNHVPGAVYWMHGIEYCGSFPVQYADLTSSLRYAGSPNGLNDDSFTLYEGESFTGSELFSTQGYPSLDFLDFDGSSIVLTGISPWTFFTGLSYTGVAVCAFASTDHDVGADGTTLDLGIFTTMADLGLPDNSIRSVTKGCFSDKVVRAQPLDAVHRSTNGAMGIIGKAN